MGLAVEAAQTTQTASDYTNIVNSVVNKAINQSSATSSAFNFAQYNLGSPPCQYPFNLTNGDVKITQNATINSNFSSVNTNSFSTTLRTDLKNQTESWINNNLQANQGWLAFAVGVATANNVSVSDIATDLSNSVSNDVLNQCSSLLSTSNFGIVNLCGTFNKVSFDFSQNAAITNMTSCLNNNIYNTISTNTVIDNIVEKTNDHFLVSQEGLSTIAKWLIWGAVILGVLIILGIILYLLFGGSKNAVKPEQLSALVNPELQVCAIRTKEQLKREGRPVTPRSERFLVERCLAEKRRERDFEANRDQYSRREGGEWRRREEGEGRREEGRREEGRREE